MLAGEKISVIIPVYNVGQYIDKCLKSVMNQTYRNLEIICIDDGSTDNSGKICDEYAAADNRFKVIHKKNCGYPAALNEGLNIFTGRIVCFVDPDDWLELDFYEAAAAQMQSQDADIICSGFYKDSDDKCRRMRNQEWIPKEPLGREEILNYVFKREIYPAFGAFLWNKMFKAKFFSATGGAGFRLREEIMVCCDVLLFVQCVLTDAKIVYMDVPYYHYYQRADSLMHSRNTRKREGAISAYNLIIQMLEEQEISADVLIWIKRYHCYHASVLAELAYELADHEKLSAYQREMRKYFTEYVITNREYPDRLQRAEKILELC